jgi:hypothetical protein
MNRGKLLLIALLSFVVLGAGGYVLHARQGNGAILPILSKSPSHARAPEGVRVRVEVINTTRTRGLARRATRVLRDLGYDVVEMGTAGPMRDTTLVLDRSGHPDWAESVAKALGPVSRAEARRDSSRYLDVTVLLGSAWRPPAEPLNP